MSDAATPVLKLNDTFGALFIGTMIAMSLWGAASVQLYYYFDQFPNDRWRLKVLVSVVYALDTTHQACITHSVYLYLVTNYANPLFLTKVTGTLSVMVPLSGIVCFLVQGFLLYRVWNLSEKNIFLVAGLECLSVAQFVTVTLYYAKGKNMDFTTLPSITWLSKLTNSLSAATDVCICLTLVFLLHRSRTGFSRSETLINRLIIFTINTGALTSLIAVIAVISVQVWPTKLIYVAFYVNISRLFTNTLLATLNARKKTRDGFAESYNQGSSLVVSRERSEAPVRSGRSLAIRVETETTRDNIVLGDLEHDDGGKGYPASDGTTYSYESKAL